MPQQKNTECNPYEPCENRQEPDDLLVYTMLVFGLGLCIGIVIGVLS